GSILSRRIHALLNQPARNSRRSAVLVASFVALVLMGSTASIFGSTISDRRISAHEAAQLAAVAREGTAFPIAINEQVLRQLNLLLATPDGRAHLQASLARMQNHRALISQKT